MKDMNSLSHTSWNCKYHVVFAPKYRRKAFYGSKRLEIGKNAKKIEEYIKNQLKEDEVNGQMTTFDFDPFTDSKK